MKQIVITFAISFLCPLLLIAQYTDIGSRAHARHLPSPLTQGLAVDVNATFQMQIQSEGSLLGGKNYRVRLELMHGTVYPQSGITYKGKHYDQQDFNGQIKTYLQNIRVTGIDFVAYPSGLDCSQFSNSSAAQGSTSSSAFCSQKGSGSPGLASAKITKVHLSGVSELTRAIDRLEREAVAEKQKAAKKVAQQQNKQTSATTSQQQKTQSSGQTNSSSNSKYGQTGGGSTTSAAERRRQQEEVQRKIRENEREKQRLMNEGAAAAAVLTNQGMDYVGKKLDKLKEDLDPNYVTSWSHLGLGFAGDFKNFGKEIDLQIPQSTYLNMAMNFMFISLEGRVSYNVLPVQSFSLERVNWHSQTPAVFDTIDENGFQLYDENGFPLSQELELRVGNAGWAAGFSAGINVPIKYFQFYGIYGKDFISHNNLSIELQDYNTSSFDNNKNLDAIFPTQTRVSFGINFNIPKTKLALGVSYNMFSYLLEEKKLSSHKVTYRGNNMRYRGAEYGIYKNNFEKYKYNNFGVYLLYVFSK